MKRIKKKKKREREGRNRPKRQKGRKRNSETNQSCSSKDGAFIGSKVCNKATLFSSLNPFCGLKYRSESRALGFYLYIWNGQRVKNWHKKRNKYIKFRGLKNWRGRGGMEKDTRRARADPIFRICELQKKEAKPTYHTGTRSTAQASPPATQWSNVWNECFAVISKLKEPFLKI